ncbi:MAG TPA: hypothetical protein VGC95_03020, partial [Chitinophagaceae bacterium]
AFQKQAMTDLLIPLQKGKSITYRLDSVVFTNFGRSSEIHSYLEKHEVDTLIDDNLGRPSYRVFTYLSDTTGSTPWQPNGSYYMTILDDRVEIIENNMRVIKLQVPVRDGTRWKGNKFLAQDPFGSLYKFSNDDNMGDWDFLFDGPLQPSATVEGTSYNDVYTVSENNDIDPVTDVSDYGSVSVSQEMYAKGIGLVYRELTMWEQQPNPSGVPPNVTYDPYQTGFGVKMWMVDHN